MCIFTTFCVTFLSNQSPIWILTLCISTFFFPDLEKCFLVMLTPILNVAECSYLNAAKIIFLDCYFFILTHFFFCFAFFHCETLLCNIQQKLYTFTSKAFVTCPLLPYQNPFVAMRLILLPTGSCLRGSLHISPLLHSNVHFTTPYQAALTQRIFLQIPSK